MHGEGLVTTVSLYHEGWVLPARTPIYPLWPLVLGYSGRMIGLERAADLLPRLFYVLDLVLLYLLARAVAVRLGGLRMTGSGFVPDSAHWMVLVFGLAPLYFGATTHPYTEGLAFALGFASLLALDWFERERFSRSRGWLPAALSGLFAGLAFLARTQMVGVAVGCFVALAFLAILDRSVRVGALAWSVVALATVAPWFVFLGFIPSVTANTLPRVTLPPFAGWTELPTWTAWLAHRAGSLRVMFDPWNAYSYVRSFGVVAFLVPLAAVGVLVEMVKRRKRPAGNTESRTPGILLTAMLIAGVFFFFNLMLYHSEVGLTWLFGWRHGLTFIVLMLLAVPWLVARAGRFAGAIAIVLLVSVVMSATAVQAFVRSPDLRLTKGETELVRWLDAQPRKLSVITSNAQILGAMSDTHFYWTHCEASGEMMKAMFTSLPIDAVVLYEPEMRCRFATEAGRMRLIAAFGQPRQRVFVLEPLP